MRPIIVTQTGAGNGAAMVLNIHGRPEVGLQVVVSGTVNYTVQQTLDSPWNIEPESWTWVNHPDTNLVAATSTQQGNYAYPPSMTRITLNSGSGSVVFTVNQPGIIG